MLITIVDTKLYGKFVLHKYPGKDLTNYRLASTDQGQSLVKLYQQFGLFQSHELITTTAGPLSERAFVEMFSANQKYTQMCMGIDDGCVVVTRSCFIDCTYYENIGNNLVSISGPLATISSINPFPHSIINSISIAYCEQNYQNIEKIKHSISYLLNILQYKQTSQRYLTQQINLYKQLKQVLKKQIRDIYSKHAKQYFKDDIKFLVMREIKQAAQHLLNQIHLFKMLKKFQICFSKGQQFKFQDKNQWYGSINPHLKVVQQNQFRSHLLQRAMITNQDIFHSNLEQKTLITNHKLLSTLPQIFYTDKVDKLYQKALAMSNCSLKRIFASNPQLNKKCSYHTLNFLLENNLAVDVYPFDNSKFYNLFCLNYLNKDIVDKYSRIFQKDHPLVKLINKYNNFVITKQTVEVKYLILCGVLRQVKIHIFKYHDYIQYNAKQNSEIKHKVQNKAKPMKKSTSQQDSSGFQKKNNIKEKSDENNQDNYFEEDKDQAIERVLCKYSLTNYDLNWIITKQQNSIITMKNILNYMRGPRENTNRKWGYFFVEM